MQPVTYDSEADVLYVRLNEGKPTSQTFLGDLRIIDKSADGGILGVEFIGASEGVDLADIPFAHRVDELIRESGLPIKTFA